MHRLIWVFTGRISLTVGFVMRWVWLKMVSYDICSYDVFQNIFKLNIKDKSEQVKKQEYPR